MRLLLLGSTGLLGKAVAAEGRKHGFDVIEAARNAAPVKLDITDDPALQRTLDAVAPDLIVNCAALVDVRACEENPGLAYRVNARPASILAMWSGSTGTQLVQVSTDHFFPNGGSRPHGEDEPVTLVNEYARTKFAGEAFALTSPDALVLRTSIVGIRGWGAPTLAEWAIQTLQQRQQLTVFRDAYTSSLDVRSCAKAILDLARKQETGLLNVAAGEVYTKEAFVREVAQQLGIDSSHATVGSVEHLVPPRPASLGLDVTRAEALLGYRLPGLKSVVAEVVKQYGESSPA